MSGVRPLLLGQGKADWNECRKLVIDRTEIDRGRSSFGELLHETAEHHGRYEKIAPKHDWWDWYPAYMSAREDGKSPDDAFDAARRYMEEARGIVLK